MARPVGGRLPGLADDASASRAPVTVGSWRERTSARRIADLLDATGHLS